MFWRLPHSNGVYWLSKLRVNASVTALGLPRLNLETFVRKHASSLYDGEAIIGKHHRLRARLLIQSVPQAVAEQRRRRIRRRHVTKATHQAKWP